ncbi:conserved Plasmodium protein, unknown function [Plasmodium malariae]|uniref:Protein phosphatase 1 regulatory subunit 21 N-terminal domain-containing protein n=1 Tax=Plasmodium malariae TaxID=5858 RepID=A0A1D3JIA5_PLAMA|nr:conserved Plasmodium protein, unknown function [Plasmodium malariae]SBT86215.1 conserved Plasmodium protein, unknown function [Plasmodium malariae]
MVTTFRMFCLTEYCIALCYILKKAIVEYKKDIKHLEKNNDEQKNKINIILDKNNNLLNDNNELSDKIVHLTNLLEEQKKSNSGWRNLMLLTKSSRENVQDSVAFEELGIKIKENETLHKEIDDLQNQKDKLEKELELFKNNHKEKLSDRERTIENLNDIISSSNKNRIKMESENDEIKKQIEINKIHFNEIIEKKNTHIIKIEQVCKTLKNKYYPRYKNKIDENMKYFKNYILNIIQRFSEYLVACKELFTFQDKHLNSIYQKLEKEQMGDQIDYYKFIDLKKISQTEVIFLEEAINLLANFEEAWHNKEDIEHIKVIRDVLLNIAAKLKKIFIKVNIYLCVEEYIYPTNIESKMFELKNVIIELRCLKNVILKTINIFACVLSVCPYNNDKIMVEYFKKRKIISKKSIDMNKTDRGMYCIEASYNDVYANNWSSEEENYDGLENISNNIRKGNISSNNTISSSNSGRTFAHNNVNFKKLLCERERKFLSKFEHLQNYTEKNNKIIFFLLKKFKVLLEDICYSFNFLKSYISFRMCEIKGADNVNIENYKLITYIQDLTNSFIKAIENFDIGKLQLPLVSLLSYSRFNRCMLYKKQSEFLEKINYAYAKVNVIPYNSLETSFRHVEIYKKNYIELNKMLLKKKKTIKRLRRINEQVLREFKSTVVTNKELTIKNEFLTNSLSLKREIDNEEVIVNDVQLYAEKILKFIISNNCEKKYLNIREKQLIEAYICSCIKINNLNGEIKKNVQIREQLEGEVYTKVDEIKKLNQQIEIYKEEETNIHKKYEEQMKTLHDLIVTLEKQISKLKSERSVNKFFILCTICGNKNNMGVILKNRKCLKCSSIIVFLK